jgi:uncharacterized protein YukE
MAEMGSAGIVNITHEMITSAKNAVQAYRDTAEGLHGRLTATVDNLIPGNFSGSAATGFKTFYDSTIQPVVGEKQGSTDTLGQMLDSLNAMLDGIKEAIPADEGVDEQLGKGNSGTQQ